MDEMTEKQILKTKGLHPKQMIAFFSMASLYLFYYFCKYNIGVATKEMQDVFGFSNQSIGWITTIFALTYAAGQFINGFLGDRYGPKRIMLIGAVGSVIANVCFGLSGTLVFFVLFWSINAYFSSCGWAPGCSILYRWFPEDRWGGWMGIYNAMCYLGGAIVLPIAAFAITKWGWRGAFFLPSVFPLGMAVVFALFGKNSPADAGLETEWMPNDQNIPEKRIGAKEYWLAFTNLKMNIAYFSGFGANFVRWGLLTWMVKILVEPVADGGFGLSLGKAALISSLMHYGGAFFSLILGMISDRIFKGTRWQTILISFVISGGALLFIGQGSVILQYPMGIFLLSTAMFLAGGLIQGLQTPLFDLPGDILGKELGGTGAGIMDGWMYIGASFAGLFLGWWLDTYGLLSGIFLMAVVSFVSGLLSIAIRK
ncbi:MAG: MFS transporter [Planctomycetes bacterium]|nr:MFS transporter [Planctomycetota bacterium]